MGFKQRKFDFNYDDDTRWPGLWVQMRPARISEALTLDKIIETASGDIGKVIAEAGGVRDDMLQLISECITRWNIETEELDGHGESTGNDVPAPVSIDTVAELEIPLFLDLFTRWVTAIRGVPRPLSQPSGDGEPSPEASTPKQTMVTAEDLGIEIPYSGT